MLNAINDFSTKNDYKIAFESEGKDICMILPCGLKSKTLKKEVMEDKLHKAIYSGNDSVLRDIFPSEFSFDFFLTIEAWKDLIICERRSPFETEGLSKQEAEWAWILVSQWEATPVDTADEFIDLYSQSQNTFYALGWESYLNEASQQKLIDLFSIKTPLLINYKPSKKIMTFYKSIWNPIKFNFKKS